MDIPTNITYLAALSMAAERLVEILRGLPWLSFPKASPDQPQAARDEAKRTAKVNLLAVITGIITAALAYQVGVLPVANNWPEVIVFGVLAGAGSGFWNAVLSYVLQLKNSLPAPTAAPAGTRTSAAAAGGMK